MEADTMQTMDQFIAEHGIEAEIEPRPDNPNMHGTQPMRHWLVTLWGANGRGRMMVPFSQGMGITDDPTAADVLDCLASDYSLTQDYSDGIEMAVGMGDVIESQEDVERARQTWDVITSQHEELTHILGADAVESLLYNVERL